MAHLILPLPVTGLTKPDLSIRVYSPAGVRLSAAETALTVAPASALGDYLVDALPRLGWVTWSYPAGAGYARAITPAVAAPECVLIPARTPGIDPNDFNLRLYADLTEDDSVLTVTELAGGDYRVTGWPRSTPGAWVIAWTYGGVAGSFEWTVTSALDVAGETIERRWLSERLREAFASLCPVAVPGVDFDPADAADVAPWTPAQVRDAVGYVELSLRELDADSGGATTGLAAVPAGGEGLVSSVFTTSRARVTIRVPGTSDLTLWERYHDAVRAAFLGMRRAAEGPPPVYLRQLAHRPPIVHMERDDGDWRRRDIDINFERHERVEHAAAA